MRSSRDGMVNGGLYAERVWLRLSEGRMVQPDRREAIHESGINDGTLPGPELSWLTNLL